MTIRQQTYERLGILADFLEQRVRPVLDGVKFDMGTWGGWTDGEDYLGIEFNTWALPAGALDEALPKLKECGFAGCACSWAMFCPEFIDLGFRGLVEKGEETVLGAMLEVLGIGYEEGEWIFCPNVDVQYRTPGRMPYARMSNVPLESVVARIREVRGRYAEWVDSAT
jgi:hypothetical protein